MYRMKTRWWLVFVVVPVVAATACSDDKTNTASGGAAGTSAGNAGTTGGGAGVGGKSVDTMGGEAGTETRDEGGMAGMAGKSDSVAVDPVVARGEYLVNVIIRLRECHSPRATQTGEVPVRMSCPAMRLNSTLTRVRRSAAFRPVT